MPAAASLVDHGVVDVGHEVGHHAGAERRPDAGGVVEVLDRGRDAEQRRQLAARRAAAPRRGRPPRRARSGGDGDEGAEPGVERLDPGQRVLDELGGAHLAAPGRRRPARARSGRAAGSRAATVTPRTHGRAGARGPLPRRRRRPGRRRSAGRLPRALHRHRRRRTRPAALPGRQLARPAAAGDPGRAWPGWSSRQWGAGLVGSWADWIGEATRIGDVLAAGVLGARPGRGAGRRLDQRSNLYKLLVAGAGPGPGRDVLVCTADDFPTDRYIVAGVAEARGMTVRELAGRHRRGPGPGDAGRGAGRAGRRRRPVAGGLPLRRAGRHRRGDPAGARRRRARAVGPRRTPSAPCRSSSTAAGADLAVGCTYKYLNGGPGAPAFLYVRRDLQEQLRSPIQGWFGQRDQFAMGPAYEPADGHRALRRRHAAGAGDGGGRGRRPADRRGRHRAAGREGPRA